MNKRIFVVAFFACVFAVQMGQVEVRASIIVRQNDSLYLECPAPAATASANDSPALPEVVPTDGIPLIRCLCGSLGTTSTTSTTSASAAASCLDSLPEMPNLGAEQDELLPGHVAPVPPKPPVFEQLKVPIVG